MKTHTTNYFDAFIQVAADCPITKAEIPTPKGDKQTAATLQFEMIRQHPYEYTSDDVLFEVFAIKNDLTDQEKQEARKVFFSKGQPCFCASPLTKRYGWGLHSNLEGKIALFPMESEEYQKLSQETTLKQVMAMRSSKK